jgi:hypothetical protein
MKDRFGIDWSRVRSRQRTLPQGVPFWEKPQLGRRMFFRHMATAVGGYFLMPTRPMETIAKAAVSTRGTAKNVIFILMGGAPSHTDTFDLKEGAWTPAALNPTSYGDIRFPQGLFPNLATQIDSLVFVRSVVAWAVAHGVGQAWVQLGRNPLAGLSRISPHIGSVVAMELGPQDDATRVLPAFLSLNSGGADPRQGYFPNSTAPFYVNPNGGGLGNTTHRDGAPRLDTRYGLLQKMDTDLRDSPDAMGPAVADMASLNVAARVLMYNSAVDNVFNFATTERVRYGNSSFGNACIAARNLLRSRLGTRFIQIGIGGWDNHVNIYQTNTALTPVAKQFDTGLATLIGDLKSDGLLDSTLIVAMGEFGRTVGPLNSQLGRDHYLQQSALFAGGGIKGGRAIGATDKLGAATVDPGWSKQRDVKPEDIEATIYSALGIDWTTVRHDDPLGRGFEYVPTTEGLQFGPIDELWG